MCYNLGMYKVYKHTNKLNNKVYIGITHYTIKKRWQSGYKNNPHFNRAIINYGYDGFEHEILADNLTKEQAEELERYYIAYYDSTNRDKGYNIEMGGNHHGKHSKQTIEKISNAQKGRTFNEEHKHKLRKPKSVKPSQEWRDKLSVRMIGNRYTVGRKHTEEEKQKISESNKGKHGKRVVCSDGREFNSITETARFYNLPRHTVLNMCRNVTKKSFKTDLFFKYKEE